ncbi:MAG: hypothetical protein ACO3UU_17785, partial [Minisyncoccia bacterium]
GDTMHNHSVLRSEILTEFKNHINSCLEHCRKYYYVLGNHDQYLPDSSKYHALQCFNIDNFNYFDKKTDIGDITFVPYINDISKFPLKTKPICIAHQTFIGADYGYYRPDVGVDADKVSADIIISGHIHKRQSFGKVHYIGTPVSHDLNDIDQAKCIAVFDTDTYKFEYIYSPFPAWRSIDINIDSEFSITDINEHILSRVNDTDKWVIRLTGLKSDIFSYIETPSWRNIQKKYNITLKPIFINSNKKGLKKIKATNFFNIVDEYIDQIYNGAVDKETLKHEFVKMFK